jgi:hypothetical protein
MFPPPGLDCATRYTRNGVPVDVVRLACGTRVYYPIVADWIDQEIEAGRRRRLGGRWPRRDQPPP